MLTLYGSPGSRSTRVAWALEEIGAEYDYIKINLRRGSQYSPAYLAINPAGKVPALVDGGFVLTESAAICTYLGEKYPQSGLVPPAVDSQIRADFFKWIFFVMTELEQPLWTLWKHEAVLPMDKRLPQIAPTAQWEFAAAARILALRLDRREYLVGDGFTAADIFAAETLSWARNAKVALGHAALERYADAVLARPAHLRARDRERRLTPFKQ
ncbi:MAG TPA: glutathione S-transferase family protein [Gammaproteobacteria bacterium]|nr:glutathione S-transferase family protein [Gammaproteobacteria bacterium]